MILQNLNQFRHVNKTRVQGFTLIELLITLSIFGILAYAATPSFTDILLKKNLETAKTRIISSLEKAKKIASAENTFVEVSIVNDVITLNQTNKNNTLTIKIPGQIITSTPVTFTFNPTGTLSNPDGQSIESITSININPRSNPSVFKIITISNTGIIASL